MTRRHGSVDHVLLHDLLTMSSDYTSTLLLIFFNIIIILKTIFNIIIINNNITININNIIYEKYYLRIHIRKH